MNAWCARWVLPPVVVILSVGVTSRKSYTHSLSQRRLSLSVLVLPLQPPNCGANGADGRGHHAGTPRTDLVGSAPRECLLGNFLCIATLS